MKKRTNKTFPFLNLFLQKTKKNLKDKHTESKRSNTRYIKRNVKTNKAQYDGILHVEVQIPLLKKTLTYGVLGMNN